MTSPIEFRQYSTDDTCYQQALVLRNQILRLPLGLDLQLEDLTEEVSQWHFGLWRGPNLVASVTIKPLRDGRVKLRQMCVSPDEQGNGLGSLLVKKVEEELVKHGITEIELAARATVVPFYQRLGYESIGPLFTEVTIAHQTMIKQLTKKRGRG